MVANDNINTNTVDSNFIFPIIYSRWITTNKEDTCKNLYYFELFFFIKFALEEYLFHSFSNTFHLFSRGNTILFDENNNHCIYIFWKFEKSCKYINYFVLMLPELKTDGLWKMAYQMSCESTDEELGDRGFC